VSSKRVKQCNVRQQQTAGSAIGKIPVGIALLQQSFPLYIVDLFLVIVGKEIVVAVEN
jgi:hypothetical protein